METFYTYCAAIGGALLVAQMALSLMGLGDHGDLDGVHDAEFHSDPVFVHTDAAHAEHADEGGQWFVGILSFRSIVSALAVFGLVGMGLNRQYDPARPAATFVIALTAGGGVMYTVGWLLRSLHRLKHDGTVRIERTIGLLGSAYLTIPANKVGAGKVTVKVQDRLMEYAAMTAGEEIPTGTAVVVVNILSPGMVEVAPAKSVSEQPVESEAHG